ncbi:rCG22633 [Rattus norvegicus]|uniref:RCG22633 n=1 Tax=Rattus norvegicus TaxID=10116 RepID=A6KNK8_RAT|nr:rCG22633 [Rattus norvegicus]
MLSSVERALKAHKCVGSHCPSLACDTHEGSKNTGELLCSQRLP